MSQSEMAALISRSGSARLAEFSVEKKIEGVLNKQRRKTVLCDVASQTISAQDVCSKKKVEGLLFIFMCVIDVSPSFSVPSFWLLHLPH